jgi:iron(III) transport system permease protein
MISCLWLERPGKVRWLAALGLLMLAALPAVPLCWQAIADLKSLSPGWTFSRSLLNSATVAVLVAGLAFLGGLPAGALAALYDFPGRRLFLTLVALPLLVPSFLWAIGWSAFAAHFGPWATYLISGYTGCTLVFFSGAFALVLFATVASTQSLTSSQIEAARLAGGEKTVVRYVICHAAVLALLAATLAGIMTLSDPGPGQILLLQTAASEVLTSFAAQYDFALAGRQCVFLAAVVLLLSLPLAFVAAPRLAAEILARQTRSFQRVRPALLARWLSIAWPLFLALFFLAPIVGLLMPILGGLEWEKAQRELVRTGANTLLYSFGAGMIAIVLGFSLAGLVGNDQRLRVVTLGICLTLFSLPPTLSSLGIMQASTAAPAWTDLFLRSRFVVCLALGLRFLPVAVLLGMRAWGSMSPSWVQAGTVHGVSLTRYLYAVVIPWFLPTAALAVVLVALLALGEVGVVLLLYPPGESSLPLTIFTIMANAPEALVASLCLVYLTAAVALLFLLWSLGRRQDT